MTTPGCSDIRVTGVDGETIHQWFTQGPRPASSTDPLADSWGQIQTQLAQVRESVQKVLSDAGAVWSGESADAMQAAVTPMATWADNASTAAAMAKSAVMMQSSDFGNASSSVVPVAPEPDKPWQADVPFFGGMMGGDDYDAAVAAREAQTRHNQAVATSYAGSSASNVSYMPQFSAPPDINSGVVAPTTQPPGVGDNPAIPGQVGGSTPGGTTTGPAGISHPGYGVVHEGHGIVPTQPPTVTPVGTTTAGTQLTGSEITGTQGTQGATGVGTGSGVGPGVGGAGTSPAGTTVGGVGRRNPAGAGTGVGMPGTSGTRRGSGLDGAGGVGGVGAGRGSAGAGSLGGRGAGSGGSAGRGVGGVGGRGAGSFGGGSGSGGSAGGRGSFGPGGSGSGAGPGSGSSGSGARGGFGPGGSGAAGEGGVGGGGTAAGGGRGGGAPMGMGGGRRGGGDDDEHQTPEFLKTVDAFGVEQLVSPPVIGGDPPR